ncbi:MULTISPECIES: D-alanine--D-alanine ligase [Pseudomonas]|uniref:D-alanine--D-alanine ligase family protein n=1 Tax=Pseudomonas guariconensis TaxID=1288410 RepID=UPI0020970CD6|nr:MULTISPECIES: D-alanine--D-alanine ligase [Pseudomonas]MCO7595855.1 D-alanine--D-alanine ligase [Pseudomonas guariconensis]MCU7221741.1 D-alanine--D-alanine ligase [Pseudomonas brassicacearum]
MTENIAIITGGDSSERDVSLQTAEAVSQSLRRSQVRHEVFTIPEYKNLFELKLEGFTRVFLAFHGGCGENGMAQAYLEGLNMPYNGPSPQASAICMDKLLTKHIARGLGINVANYLYLRDIRSASFDEAKQQLGDTCIIKPNSEGCSFGVSLVHDNPKDFYAAIERALHYKSGILIEEFIAGPELSVCYLFGHVLPIFALGFTSDFFSYEAKFLSTKTTAKLITLPRHINQKLKKDCKSIAEAIDLDYFRADIIIHDEKPYLIELNTLPGLTSHSLFPKACHECGIEFDELVLLLNNLHPVCDS